MKRRDFLFGLPAMTALPALSAQTRPGPTADPGTPPEPSAEWARHFRATPAKDHGALRERLAAGRTRDPRPNILLILTDQQTFDAMGCAGNPHVRTPNMDQLARRGVRFDRCYCQSAVCSPSRASLLTGRMPHETGVRHNNLAIDASLPNIGHVLREAGYDTTWVGKWHLPQSYPATPEIPGFHHLPLPADLAGKHLGDATDMHKAQTAATYLRYHAGLSANPWLLGVSLHNPHDICLYFHPEEKPGGIREPDPDETPAGGPPLPPLPANFATDPDEPEFLIERRAQGEMAMMPNLLETHWRKYLQTYYHMTQSVDRCLRPLVAALEQGGWSDNTLVIFASDHGEGMASHRWFTKLGFYEPVARVPLIVVPPRNHAESKGRADRDTLASLADLAPTLFDYARIPADQWPSNLRGHSLRPAVEGEQRQKSGRDFVVCHLDPDPARPERTARMLVTADGWKLCRYSHGARPEQLFDLNADPGETRNLAADPTAAAQRNRLLTLLKDWCSQTGDPFLDRIPQLPST